MRKFAQTDAEERNLAIQGLQEEIGRIDAIVEKDFWVCFALDFLFKYSAYKDKFAFKGGTNLSKVYKVIDRFSEDIDIILDWRVLGLEDSVWLERSNNQQKIYVKKTDEMAREFLHDKLIPELFEHCNSINLKDFSFEVEEKGSPCIIFHYPVYQRDESIMQVIRLEIGPLGAWTPVKREIVVPYLGEVSPSLFNNIEVNVKAVEGKRTFWEKIVILHQESNRTNGATPDRYSRHYYDVFRMTQSSVYGDALDDIDLLNDVVKYSKKFYYRKFIMYDAITCGKINLIPSESAMKILKADYAAMEPMIFDNPPKFDLIIESLITIENEINTKIKSIL